VKSYPTVWDDMCGPCYGNNKTYFLLFLIVISMYGMICAVHVMETMLSDHTSSQFIKLTGKWIELCMHSWKRLVESDD
jgi:hypothetical protein